MSDPVVDRVVKKMYGDDRIPLPERADDAATYSIGSDRYPYTIVEQRGRVLLVRKDDYIGKPGRNNAYTEDQGYLYFANEYAPIERFSFRKNGHYYRVGSAIGAGGVLHVGTRRAYRDPSF